MTEDLPREQATPEERARFNTFTAIFFIALIDLLGVTLVLPLLPFYGTLYGADAFTIGLLAAAYPLAQFVGAPILGYLSDRFGRRPVLIFSLIGSLLGFLLLALANNLVMIFIARIIDGLSGANIATLRAVISDVTGEKQRAAGQGLIGAAFGMAFIIGPATAFGLLGATDNDLRAPAAAAVLYSLLAILIALVMLPETSPAEKSASRVSVSLIPARGTRRLMLLLAGQQLAFSGFEQLVALFALARLGMNAQDNAFVFLVVGFILVIVQGGVLGRLTRRYAERTLVIAGLVLLAAGLFMVASTPSLPVAWYWPPRLERELTDPLNARTVEASTPNLEITLPPVEPRGWTGWLWFLAAMVPTAVGAGLLRPVITSMLTKRVPPESVGAVMGTSTAMMSAASAAAPVIGGALFVASGAAAPFYAGGMLLVGLTVIALRTR